MHPWCTCPVKRDNRASVRGEARPAPRDVACLPHPSPDYCRDSTILLVSCRGPRRADSSAGVRTGRSRGPCARGRPGPRMFALFFPGLSRSRHLCWWQHPPSPLRQSEVLPGCGSRAAATYLSRRSEALGKRWVSGPEQPVSVALHPLHTRPSDSADIEPDPHETVVGDPGARHTI